MGCKVRSTPLADERVYGRFVREEPLATMAVEIKDFGSTHLYGTHVLVMIYLRNCPGANW
jgi:hypothetical protein